MTDTHPGGINAAIAELQAQLPRIAKDQTANVPTKAGGSYRYTYADLAQVSLEVLPLLGKLGLSFTSRPTLRDGRFVLVYELRHVSGEMIDGEYPLPSPERGTPQEIGGAITYARRYCLCAVTGVAPDDDDDDAVAAERAASRRERRGAQTQRRPAADGEPAITADDQRTMQRLFREAGIIEREKKVGYASGVVERPLGSATELTHAEAQKVIGKLAHVVERRQTADGPGDGAESEKAAAVATDEAEAWLATQQPPVGVA